jgi:hypothetical protein
MTSFLYVVSSQLKYSNSWYHIKSFILLQLHKIFYLITTTFFITHLIQHLLMFGQWILIQHLLNYILYLVKNITFYKLQHFFFQSISNYCEDKRFGIYQSQLSLKLDVARKKKCCNL